MPPSPPNSVISYSPIDGALLYESIQMTEGMLPSLPSLIPEMPSRPRQRKIITRIHSTKLSPGQKRQGMTKGTGMKILREGGKQRSDRKDNQLQKQQTADNFASNSSMAFLSPPNTPMQTGSVASIAVQQLTLLDYQQQQREEGTSMVSAMTAGEQLLTMGQKVMSSASASTSTMMMSTLDGLSKRIITLLMASMIF
jgi:hypothetical protein